MDLKIRLDLNCVLKSNEKESVRLSVFEWARVHWRLRSVA